MAANDGDQLLSLSREVSQRVRRRGRGERRLAQATTRSTCVVCCSLTMVLARPPGSSKVASRHDAVGPVARRLRARSRQRLRGRTCCVAALADAVPRSVGARPGLDNRRANTSAVRSSKLGTWAGDTSHRVRGEVLHNGLGGGALRRHPRFGRAVAFVKRPGDGRGPAADRRSAIPRSAGASALGRKDPRSPHIAPVTTDPPPMVTRR